MFNEALVGVIRIRDIWVKNFRDMGHLRNKLIWDISKFTWQPGGQSDSLMLLWFKDLMNVTKKLQSIDPTFRHSCPVPSSGVKISGDIFRLIPPNCMVG